MHTPHVYAPWLHILMIVMQQCYKCSIFSEWPAEIVMQRMRTYSLNTILVIA
jgi:hypothetical protein